MKERFLTFLNLQQWLVVFLEHFTQLLEVLVIFWHIIYL